MAVTVSPSVLTWIREDPGGILVQVTKASDPEAAADALRAARADIAALDGGWRSAPGLRPGDTNGPKYVGSVSTTPAGPVLSVDGGYTPTELLETIPDIVARHLAAAGVDNARITVPRDDGPVTYHLERAVVLHLYPPVPAVPDEWVSQVPDGWLAEAAEWVGGDLGDHGELWALTEVQFPLAPADALALLRRRQGSGGCFLAGGEMQARVRAADLSSLPPVDAGPAPWPAPGNPGGLIAAVDLLPYRADGRLHFHTHLDVFVDGRPVPVPGSIGIGPEPSSLHTHSPSGILHIEADDPDATFSLGDLFALWGVRLSGSCVGAYCRPEADVAVYVDGQPLSGPLDEILLDPYEEIAVVIGTPPDSIPSSYDCSTASREERFSCQGFLEQ